MGRYQYPQRTFRVLLDDGAARWYYENDVEKFGTLKEPQLRDVVRITTNTHKRRWLTDKGKVGTITADLSLEDGGYEQFSKGRKRFRVTFPDGEERWYYWDDVAVERDVERKLD